MFAVIDSDDILFIIGPSCAVNAQFANVAFSHLSTS